MNRYFAARSVLCALGVYALSGCVTPAPVERPLENLESLEAVAGAAEAPENAAENAENSAEAAGQAGADARNTAADIDRAAEELREEQRERIAAQRATEEIHMVRYIGGSTRDWPNRHNGSSQLDQNYGFADLYSRFILISADDAPGVGVGADAEGERRSFRSYRAERPHWLARLFTEEERSIVAVARISVMNPALEMTVPLYSVSYNSGGKGGEAWATAITSSYVRSPLFRITGNSRFAVNITTKTSDATQSSGVSTAISALTSVVELVAPEAGVLTTLSEDATSDRAKALDSAISSLLSYSISEEIEFGRMINSWRPDAEIRLDGCAPFVRAEGDPLRDGTAPRQTGSTAGRVANTAERDNKLCAGDRDLDRQQNHYVGRWRLVLTCPQFSVFSSRSLCKYDNATVALENISTAALRGAIQGQIAATVPDSLVLEEQLGENATIRSVIRGSDFFIAFVDVEQPTAVQYGQFCASVMDVLRQKGLTGLDAALGLRATMRLMPEFVGDRGNAPLTANCKALLGDFGVVL